MTFVRLILLIVAVEALFYVLISIYVRSLRRERLEERWNARHPDQAGDSRERREFVRRSMVGFERSLKARLAWLVFVLPTLAILATVYFVNFK